jgi:hypothetical protein
MRINEGPLTRPLAQSFANPPLQVDVDGLLFRVGEQIVGAFLAASAAVLEAAERHVGRGEGLRSFSGLSETGVHEI